MASACQQMVARIASPHLFQRQSDRGKACGLPSAAKRAISSSLWREPRANCSIGAAIERARREIHFRETTVAASTSSTRQSRSNSSFQSTSAITLRLVMRLRTVTFVAPWLRWTSRTEASAVVPCFDRRSSNHVKAGVKVGS